MEATNLLGMLRYWPSFKIDVLIFDGSFSVIATVLVGLVNMNRTAYIAAFLYAFSANGFYLVILKLYFQGICVNKDWTAACPKIRCPTRSSRFAKCRNFITCSTQSTDLVLICYCFISILVHGHTCSYLILSDISTYVYGFGGYMERYNIIYNRKLSISTSRLQLFNEIVYLWRVVCELSPLDGDKFDPFWD